ncbi:MAG: hypothetical protein V4665_02260 [Patescibacteria group bacterium]
MNTLPERILFIFLLLVIFLIPSTKIFAEGGASSVLFLPGFEASRMYKTKSILGIITEDQLWEPNTNNDVRDMFMDGRGISIDENIYTRDIIDEGNIIIPSINIYKSFISSMDSLVADNIISDWKAIAYDWRFAVDDIVSCGFENSDGSISYDGESSSVDLPYIISELKRLAHTSKNGKVTVVTHSNGGLLAKALVKELADMKKAGGLSLVDSIDKVIMVAPPELGAVSALAALLHGYAQNFGWGFFLKESVAREFAENLPGAYGLLPSPAYFDAIEDPVILFDQSLDEISDFRKIYGDAIDSFDEFRSFVLDSHTDRIKPAGNDLESPAILNASLFDDAVSLHASIDDFDFPSHIDVSQVAGWGMPTVKNIRYYAKHECVAIENATCHIGSALAETFDITSDGDKTVASASALYGNADKYYLNLQEYNKNHYNRGHKDIFEIPSVDMFVKNSLTQGGSLPEYFSQEKPPSPDIIIIRMKSPVSIDIYDEEKRHTGQMAGTNPDFTYIEEEIPNSAYMRIGDEKIIIVPAEDEYVLEMQGLDKGIFTLEIETLHSDISAGTVVFADVPVTPHMKAEAHLTADGEVSGIAMDKDGDGVYESTVLPSDRQTSEDTIDLATPDMSSIAGDFRTQSGVSEHVDDKRDPLSLYTSENIPFVHIVRESSLLSEKESSSDDGEYLPLAFEHAAEEENTRTEQNDSNLAGAAYTKLAGKEKDVGIIALGSVIAIMILLVLKALSQKK